MIQLKKPYPWSLQRGWTTIYPFIFYSDYPAAGSDLDHEEVHRSQQLSCLLVPYWLTYALLFPIFFNPFRYYVEWSAYRKANGYSPTIIRRLLSGSLYGWLIPALNEWVIPKDWR